MFLTGLSFRVIETTSAVKKALEDGIFTNDEYVEIGTAAANLVGRFTPLLDIALDIGDYIRTGDSTPEPIGIDIRELSGGEEILRRGGEVVVEVVERGAEVVEITGNFLSNIVNILTGFFGG
jgi:hypothetical protein